MCFAAFLEMIRTSKRSAPGPDGIPYLAWATSLRAQVFLFQACLLWLFCGTCPVFFNVAYLWLLPKSAPEDGIFDPRDTRPLSGANSDAKIVAKFLSMTFNMVLENWAYWKQRGFIQGRCMIRNVIEIETCVAKMAFNPASGPCVIFFDFAAAFPSLARAFIWIVLESGIPRYMIRAIQALYCNNLHFTCGARGLSFAFCAGAGVRLGCPLKFLYFRDCDRLYYKSDLQESSPGWYGLRL